MRITPFSHYYSIRQYKWHFEKNGIMKLQQQTTSQSCFTKLIKLVFWAKPKFIFLNLKKGVQEFHRRFVLAPADKAENVVVV